MNERDFREKFLRMVDFTDNPFHPLLWINGEPEIGPGTYIGGFSEIYAEGAKVVIGRDCDIASFVAINVADSHERTIGIGNKIDARDIFIGDCVFIGSHSVILGGATIGERSVIAAGTVVRAGVIAPYSLVIGNPAIVKPAYYRKKYEDRDGPFHS